MVRLWLGSLKGLVQTGVRFAKANHWLVAGILVVLVGLVANRCAAGRVREIEQRWDDYQAGALVWQRERDAARAWVEVERKRADSLGVVAFRAEAGANTARQARVVLRGRVDALNTALEYAENAADSLPIVVHQRDLAIQALDSAEVESLGLREALADQTQRALILGGVADSQTTELGAYRNRLTVAEKLAGDAVKAAKGCRIPLLGLPCPTLAAGYGLALAGGTVVAGPVVAVVIPFR